MKKQRIDSAPNCEDRVDPSTLHFEEAKTRMLSDTASLTEIEELSITSPLTGRVLAENIYSPINVPNHTNSAVDGFAINGGDIPADGLISKLGIQGTALAGHPYPESVKPGNAIRITTGAPMPAQSDTVIMLEQASESDGTVSIDDRHKPGQNVRQAGEDVSKGDQVMTRSHALSPADIGVLASLGLSQVKVLRKLRVSIFSTGDELTAQGTPLPPGGIYDSNRHTMAALLSKLPNVEIVQNEVIKDDADTLLSALLSAAEKSDLILTSGGVSVGVADYTKKALETAGHINFWKIALKPGRPLAFGNIKGATFIGLPGNPVAVMVTFYLLALPVIWKKSGAIPPTQYWFPVKTSEPLKKKPGRTEIQRGILHAETESQPVGTTWQVSSTGAQGSGILTSMSKADVLIYLEHDRDRVEIGESVPAILISSLL